MSAWVHPVSLILEKKDHHKKLTRPLDTKWSQIDALKINFKGNIGIIKINAKYQVNSFISYFYFKWY